MTSQKKKSKSNHVLDFISGYLGRKENKSPVSKIVRAKQKRDAAIRKALGR